MSTKGCKEIPVRAILLTRLVEWRKQKWLDHIIISDCLRTIREKTHAHISAEHMLSVR